MTPRAHNFVFVSDLHIGGDGQELHHAQELCTIMGGSLDPANTLVVVCGDCTENGDPDEIEHFARWCDSLEARGLSVACVPGNHDAAWMGVGGVEDARRGRFIVSCVQPRLCMFGGENDVWYVNHGGVLVIMIDSTRGLRGWVPGQFDLARGLVGDDAWATASRYAREHRGPVALVLHHHPTYITHIVEGDNRLIDVSALRAWVKLHRPVFVVCGHKHEAKRLRMDGAGLVLSCPKTTSPMRLGRDAGYGAWWLTRQEGGAQRAQLHLF